jgi:hypothetical protein
MTVVGYSGLFFYKDRVLANPSVTVGDTFPCRDGFKWFGFYLLEKSKSTLIAYTCHFDHRGEIS